MARSGKDRKRGSGAKKETARRPTATTGTGAPGSVVQKFLGDPPSHDTVRQLQDAFGRPPRQREQSDQVEFDYDDIVQQSFPASDPPPPPG